MTETLLISNRGQITLPANVRKKYALTHDTPLILEETKDGLLLRKASVVPIKTYSQDDIDTFLSQDKILPRDKKWIK